jgi:hypothetical protein
VGLLALNWGSLAPESLADSIANFFGEFGASKYPLTFSSGDFRQTVALGGNIGVLTDTSFSIYSQTGAQLVSRQHGMSDPQLVAAGGKAVLFDRGGKSFREETRFGEPFVGTADYPIITAAVSSSGDIAVVTESGGYLSELTVYDASNKSVFKWYSSQGRIQAAAISPDGSKVAAAVLGSKNGEYTTSIYIFNTGRQKPLSVSTIDGTMIFSIQYIDNDRVAAVGDIQSVFLSGDGSKKTEYAYGGKVLKCFANSNGATALVFGAYGEGNSSEVVSFSGSGKVEGKTEIGDDVSSVYAGDGKLIALTEKYIWQGNLDCSHAGTIPVEGDKTAALPLKGNLYVFGVQTVQRYALPQ